VFLRNDRFRLNSALSAVDEHEVQRCRLPTPSVLPAYGATISIHDTKIYRIKEIEVFVTEHKTLHTTSSNEPESHLGGTLFESLTGPQVSCIL
jgi:hypothetical protein